MPNPDERNPTFLLVGAQKAGTTALYSLLRQHPQIFMSPVKEPDYFARKEILSYLREGKRAPSYVRDWDAYLALFKAARPGQAIGEASTSYLYSPSAPADIRERLPDVKLLAILRDPTRRAYSNYLHCLRRGIEPLAFMEALKAEPARIAAGWGPNWHYRTRGCYFEQLMRFRNQFPTSQLRILLYESFVRAPGEVMRQVFEYLGVDPGFVPNLASRHNVSGVPKWRPLAPVLAAVNPYLPALKRIVPDAARTFLRSLFLASPALETSVEIPLRESYREGVLELEREFGLALGHWLQPAQVKARGA